MAARASAYIWAGPQYYPHYLLCLSQGWSKLAGLLSGDIWVSWEEKKTGLPLAAQQWADCAMWCDKLKCMLACLTRTISTVPTRVMLGTSDATFCCCFSFTPSSLLTKLRHKNVRNMSFAGGVRKYCYSEQERTKSVTKPICRSLKSLYIVIK